MDFVMPEEYILQIVRFFGTEVFKLPMTTAMISLPCEPDEALMPLIVWPRINER
jgi:hypothetical protein